MAHPDPPRIRHCLLVMFLFIVMITLLMYRPEIARYTVHIRSSDITPKHTMMAGYMMHHWMP